LAVEIVGALSVLLSVRYLVRHLGTEAYGVIALVGLFASQLGILYFGIGPAVTRRLAAYRGQHDFGRAATAVSAGIASSFVTSVVVGVVFRLAAPWAWTHMFEAQPAAIRSAMASINLMAAIAATQPLFGTLCGILVGEERFAELSAIRLAQAIFRAAASVLAVARGGGIEAVLWTYLATELAGICASLSRVQVRGVEWRGTIHEVRGLLHDGPPFALADFCAGLLVNGEKLAVSIGSSIAQFTFYSVPFNAASRFTIFGSSLSGVLLPRIGHLAAAGDFSEALRLTRRATRLSVAAMMIVTVPLVALTPELLRLWLGAEFETRSTGAMRIVFVGLVVNASVYAYYAVVRVRSHPATLTVLYAAELPVFAALIYFFVPRYGIAGAAMAWSLRVLVDTIAQRRVAEAALGAAAGDGLTVWGSATALTVFAIFCSYAPLWARAAVAAALTVSIFNLLLGLDQLRQLLQSVMLPASSRSGEELS
jgi:O-antigen/teichoic acid export membrane protein